MARLALAVPLAALGLSGGLGALTGCEDLRCCNSCGRNYTIGDPLAYPAVSIVGIDEGGNECEIDEVPRAIEDGLHTLRVRVQRIDDAGERGTGYGVEVLEHAPGDVADERCLDLEILDAATLIAREPAVQEGTSLCLVDEVAALESCTQKACGGV